MMVMTIVVVVPMVVAIVVVVAPMVMVAMTTIAIVVGTVVLIVLLILIPVATIIRVLIPVARMCPRGYGRGESDRTQSGGEQRSATYHARRSRHESCLLCFRREALQYLQYRLNRM